MQIKLIHEKDIKYSSVYEISSVYAEYFPGFVTRITYFNTDALRQEFGHIPEKLVLIIEEDKDSASRTP